jgi:hypothetical protein
MKSVITVVTFQFKNHASGASDLEDLAFHHILFHSLGKICRSNPTSLTYAVNEQAVLEEACRNQKFNASDTSPLPMNRFWPELGRWYGVPEIKGPELDESKFTVIDPGDVPTPLGYACRFFPKINS